MFLGALDNEFLTYWLVLRIERLRSTGTWRSSNHVTKECADSPSKQIGQRSGDDGNLDFFKQHAGGLQQEQQDQWAEIDAAETR